MVMRTLCKLWVITLMRVNRMKTTLWKTTVREIKSSLGRFLAILAIVALGVGMFAGLKVTQPFVVQSVEEYFDKHNFFERINTTLLLPINIKLILEKRILS